MAEGRRVQIESNRQILGLLLLQHFKENIQKPVHRICMKPLSVRKQRDPVERPVQNAVSVN